MPPPIPPKQSVFIRALRSRWPGLFLLVCLVLAASASRPPAADAVASASAPCSAPNLISPPVCDFDSFSGSWPRELPDGWSPFVLGGELEFVRDSHGSCFGGDALRMRSDGGTFTAGIYTQVEVTPGAGYRASISWGAPTEPDTFGRQLGIDPNGGTDPTSPAVVWGPMHWGAGRILNYPPGEGPNIDVLARAQGSRVTVFFLVEHPRSTGDNMIFVDVIALYPDAAVPVADPLTEHFFLPLIGM